MLEDTIKFTSKRQNLTMYRYDSLKQKTNSVKILVSKRGIGNKHAIYIYSSVLTLSNK